MKVVALAAERRYFASPKSLKTHSPLGNLRTLLGLISLWMTPAACSASTPCKIERKIVTLSALFSVIGLTAIGCGTGGISRPPISGSGGESATSITAHVAGGRKPISGSSITLYEAGTTGRGSAASVLATSTSNSQGNFFISSFHCASPASQVFITSAGGDAGDGENSNIVLIAMLGPCNALPSNVVINELSTVAAAFSTVVPPSGGNAPTNTLQAALDIALSPGKNVATIYGLLSKVPVAPPYTPALSKVPNDWLLALSFTPGDLSITRGMAIDQAGNVWIANATSSSIIEISPLGKEVSPLGGYTSGGTLDSPEDLYFDSGGKLWVANYGNSTIEALSSSGVVVVPPFGSGSVSRPTGIVTDSFNQVWISNSSPSSSSEELTVGTTAGAFSFGVGGFGLGTPNRMIADKTVSPNIMWVSNSGTGGVSKIVNNGTEAGLTGAAIPGGGQESQQGITLDNNGAVWVSNTSSTDGSVTKISGTAVSLGPIAIGGITSTTEPWGIAADSANNVWVNNFNNNYVTELDTNGNALSPSGGFTAGGLVYFPRNGIAIDRGGNVWIPNDGNGNLIELLGAAGPVATPRSSGRPIAP
jgi:hypothetical protein